MELQQKELDFRDKYGNRKRGDNWEGRVTIMQQQVSLYDIDTRRLEMRKKALKEKSNNLINMEKEYKQILNSMQFISIEYFEKLRNQSVTLYNEIIEIVNSKRKSKFITNIDLIYNNINHILNSLKCKNPELNEMSKDLKVDDWFYKWLWTYKYCHKAKSTFRGYVSKTKNHIIKTFGDKYLSEVTTLEIQMYINSLMGKYSASTIKQIYLLLKEGFDRAVKDKIIKQSPVIDIEIPAIVPHTMMSIDIQLEKKLINIFKSDEMSYPFAILVDTGLRTSELCGLKWENIDFKNKKIYVRQSYQRVDNYEFVDGKIVRLGSSLEETALKSRTSKREIPMSKGVFKILNEIFNETLQINGKVDDKSFVFINKKGNPIVGDCLRCRLDEFLSLHNLKGISLHRFRHTFATRLYEAQVKLKNIQTLLGHSTVKMTERYLHINEEEQTESIEQLENYYKKVGIFNY